MSSGCNVYYGQRVNSNDILRTMMSVYEELADTFAGNSGSNQ